MKNAFIWCEEIIMHDLCEKDAFTEDEMGKQKPNLVMGPNRVEVNNTKGSGI